MIPVFPSFTPIDLGLVEEYQRFVNKHPPYSDFNFASLTCWNRDHSGKVAYLNGNLVITLPSYTEHKLMVSVLGTAQLEDTVSTLLDYAAGVTGNARLELVPELVISHLSAHHDWHIAEDTSNHDYMLSLELMTHADGPDFRRYRRNIRLFVRHHEPTMSFHNLDLTLPLTQQAMVDVFQRREHQKNPSIQISNELMAMKQLLEDQATHQLVGYGVSIRGALQGFIICDVSNQLCALGLFWKADTTYSGIYSFLMQQTVQRLTGRGTKQLNIAQDLGIDGLHFAKRAYAPVGHLKKYTIAAC